MAGVLGGVFFLASIARVFAYYAVPIFACAAPVAAFGLVEAARAAARRGRGGPARGWGMAALAAFAAGQAYAWWPPAENGEPLVHEWRGSGVGALDAVVRNTVWRSREVPERRALAVQHYLWEEIQRFDALGDFTEAVEVRTGPDDRLFGDSTAAPLVALRSGRRLAFDEADTNVQRLQRPGHGEALLERLREDPPALVLVRAQRGIAALPAFQAWIARDYEPVLIRDDPPIGLFGRRGDRRLAPPSPPITR